jgi:hypothetical protein
MLISKPIFTQIKNSHSSMAKPNMRIFQMVTLDGGVLGLFGVKDLRGAQK